MIALSIAANVGALQTRLRNIAEKQIPFAAAMAATALAKRVQAAETKALPQVFDRPTPFTQHAFGVKPATKASPTALVFTRPIQASYLQPYERGGFQVPLHGRAILKPVHIALNAYGNLPRNIMQRLKGRRDVFIATIHGVTAVWQDPNRDRQTGKRYGFESMSKRHSRLRHGQRIGLNMLVRIADPSAVHQHLDFGKRGHLIVATYFRQEFRTALRKALGTAH